MAVKPSAITGAGTENNPYVIHNYTELKWCCEDADAVPEGQTKLDYVYVKLNNDIDCSTYGMSFRWIIDCDHAIDLNLNNKTIENFYIHRNGYLFSVPGTVRKLSVHDGKILNVYGDWISRSVSVMNITANSDDSTVTFKNISMSIDATNFSASQTALCSGYPNRLTMTNCTIDFKGTTTTVVSLVSSARLFTCDIHVDIVTTNTAAYLLSGSSSYMGYALNCRFMGRIQLRTITTTSYGVYYCQVRNCVFDVEILSTTTSTSTPSFVYGGGAVAYNYGIYNADKVPNYNFNGTNYIACTTADMDMRVNPNADIVLQEKGFDVIKG